MVNEYIISAPSSVNPGVLIRYFSKNRIGNKLLEKLVLNEKALLTMLRLFKGLGLVDKVSHDILCKEVSTAELRFNLYACFTYLRFLETDDEYFNYNLTPVPGQGRWYIYGLFLPDEVLHKIYYQNAEGLLLRNNS